MLQGVSLDLRTLVGLATAVFCHETCSAARMAHVTSPPKWLDLEKTSVLLLKPIEEAVDPHQGPRLIVSLEDDGSWKGFAVTSTGTIEELAAVAPDRAHAKVLVVEQTLELLKDPTVSFSEHAEFAALQPLLSDADHP